ncbi:type II toxin-antitoxin system RelE/ParE family toxin [Bythopirellula goksoeyrii]|uniref:type II toxin-antitoxin system RelE/ParE family toxin n=1 Tax=Bythopirellula goksoeyrii TaxID=1400387 RepID=UPI00143D72F8
MIVTSEVFAALDAHIEYIATEKQAPLNAQRWLSKAWAKLQTLKSYPHRCPPAPENEQFEYTVRMLVIDSCLFTFTVDEENRVVRVFGFRHGSRQ